MSPCRHTFSGLVAVALLGTALAIGSVLGAPAEAKPHAAFAAADACPSTWQPLHAGPPAERSDGNVSVFVGGNLVASGGAAGAEGVVVALGDATFTRETPGSYEVGTTSVGSQVAPFAGSDMLVVGGTLTGGPGTQVDVGRGLGGDVAVGGAVADGTDVATHGGNVDAATSDATEPYTGMLDQIASKSAAYAALQPTGTVEVTETGLVLTGDGVAGTQVFSIDPATLATDGNVVPARTLQLVGVPAGADVVVNLGGPLAELDVDGLLSPDGVAVDPMADPYFADLATHLVWNFPGAQSVTLGGLAQLPGSVLVPTRPSTTVLNGAGVNGRVLVAGDLAQNAGQVHSYPLLADPDLACGPEVVRFGTLTLDLRLLDPDDAVADDLVFAGRFRCDLDGANVTPGDDTWRMHADAETKVLSDRIPAGAECTLTQSLDGLPTELREWADPVIEPNHVTVVKRRDRGFAVTDKVSKVLPVEETPSAPPSSEPPSPDVEEPPPVEPTPTPTPSSLPEPTNAGHPVEPSTLPTPSAPATADADAPNHQAAPAAVPGPRSGGAGPLTTTAPFTLRGTFVWGPTLVLSLLTLMLRIRRRPKRERLH